MIEPELIAQAFNAKSSRFLGSGTFGETWKVMEPEGSDEPFAVKLLRPEHFSEHLLRREIESLEQISHPGILKFYEVREVTVGQQNQYALVCEFIDGGTLSQAISTTTKPSYVEIQEFAYKLLQAIAELHSKNKIHRDIKPDNIMLRNFSWSQPVLIDFGLSRSLDGGTMTLYPQRIGSIPWMSPEQLRGQKARKGSDMWAVGVILYELVVGRHPFFSRINLNQIDGDELIDLVSLDPGPIPSDVPEKLAQTITRLIIPGSPGLRGSARRAVRLLEESNR